MIQFLIQILFYNYEIIVRSDGEPFVSFHGSARLSKPAKVPKRFVLRQNDLMRAMKVKSVNTIHACAEPRNVATYRNKPPRQFQPTAHDRLSRNMFDWKSSSLNIADSVLIVTGGHFLSRFNDHWWMERVLEYSFLVKRYMCYVSLLM